jgi:hypothetical protein
MSVELLDLIDNYKIVCYNDDSTYELLKKNWGVSSYLNTEFVEELESDQVAEILLGDKNFLNRVILGREDSKVLFFYMNSKMDELLKNTGMPMLLPAYDLQEKLGNKNLFSEICKELNIAENKSLSFKKVPKNLSDLFMRCQNALGLPFIVQDALGASGAETSLAGTENELRKAGEKIKQGLRITKYLPNNIPVSVHICISNDQIIIQGPWLQLIGLPELSADPFRFTGNDTNQSLLDRSFINKVRDMSEKIGVFARLKGYQGILGVDYLWDKDTNTIYPQEINSRLVGLTRLLTGIQKDQFIFPDLLKHIEAFDTPHYSAKCKMLHPGDIDLSRHDYSQVIIRNNLPKNIIISKRIEPSIYRMRDGSLEKTKSSLFVHDMGDDDILVVSSAHEGCELYPGEVIAKFILKKSVIENSRYKLKTDAIRLVDSIKKYTTIPR